MSKIKMRRLKELILPSHPELHIGDCVPFFFCPRPVMLYVIHRGDHSELPYAGGQNPIVHLEADLHQTVAWANEHGLRWAFTLSNAGSYHFQDRRDLSQLDEINWSAVQTDDWSRPDDKEGKQAEFLIENQFPWSLVMRIGAYSARTRQHVLAALESATHNPDVQIIPGWYY